MRKPKEVFPILICNLNRWLYRLCKHPNIIPQKKHVCLCQTSTSFQSILTCGITDPPVESCYTNQLNQKPCPSINHPLMQAPKKNSHQWVHHFAIDKQNPLWGKNNKNTSPIQTFWYHFFNFDMLPLRKKRKNWELRGVLIVCRWLNHADSEGLQ